LRGGNRDGLISKILNQGVEDQPERIKKNIDPLIVVKVEGGRLVFNPLQNRIGKVVPDGDAEWEAVNQGGRKKDLIPFEGTKIRHTEEGTSPLMAKGFYLLVILKVGHFTIVTLGEIYFKRSATLPACR